MREDLDEDNDFDSETERRHLEWADAVGYCVGKIITPLWVIATLLFLSLFK